MRTYLHIAVCVAAVSVLHAATEEEVCRELSAALRQEAEVLAAVQNPASAASALPSLKDALARLAALKGQVDDNTLWNYIDSTEGVKPELMFRLRDLAVEFTRLEKARFYGDKELARLLAPQISPNAATHAAQ